MSPEKLIRMANQIATFFQSKPRAEGIAGVAEHINAYWEPQMRLQFLALVAAQPDDFHALVHEAVAGVRPATLA